MIQYRVDAAPIDGLKIGADYATEDGGSTATAQQNEFEHTTLSTQWVTLKLVTVSHFMLLV